MLRTRVLSPLSEKEKLQKQAIKLNSSTLTIWVRENRVKYLIVITVCLWYKLLMTRLDKLMVGMVTLAVLACIGVGVYASQSDVYATRTSSNTRAVEDTKPVVKQPEITILGLWQETNKVRAANNLPPLVLNEKLNQSAQAKCNDMVTRNYWSHDAPDGVEPWVFIKANGITYESAHENLAVGYYSDLGVIDGWMDSASHRENMLMPTVTDVGFGVCHSDNYANKGKQTVVVQHIIK